jgi:uncharacterized protein (TIGR02246 family)
MANAEAGARSPEELVDRYRRGMQDRDLDGLISLYGSTAVFIPKTGGQLTGHQAIGTAIAQILTLNPRLDLVTAEVFIAGDTAFLANDYMFAGTAPDGAVIKATGRSAVVLRRQPDETWRIIIDRL